MIEPGGRQLSKIPTPKKNILMSPTAFLTLRNNLIKNIGLHKTKGFLFRFGKEMGEASAKEYLADPTIKNRPPRGKRMHITYGHVKDIIIEENIERDPDGSIISIHNHGKWIESFEAEEHLKNHGPSSECVCDTLAGFATGALSYEFGQSVITIEKKCVAKGDPFCEFETRLEKDWHPEQDELLALYHDESILTELEMTYDALLHHKQMIEKISTFHYRLTQSVTERKSMEEIVQSAYEILQIPIIIEDTHGMQLLQIGLSDEQLEQIKIKQQNFQYTEKILNATYYTGNSCSKLVSPVLINKKLAATCSFFYFSPTNKDVNDHLYLEIISTVTALCLLYEAAQFEEQERMKLSILERLIHKQYQSIKDIEPYFKFLPFKFHPPFSTAVIKIAKRQPSEDLIDLYELVLHFSKLFHQHAIPTVFAITGEDIVLLNAQFEHRMEFNQKLLSILHLMEKQNKNYQFSVGVSNTFHTLTQFERSLSEARISQKFPNKERITSYEDLGILGDFVTNMSIEQLHDIARNMLKELYDFKDIRKKELLYTLYRYLSNGQKLKETMEELALSIGGIQYRIKQIETMIQKNLKNASNAAYILIVIEALILLGELQFDDL